MPRPLTALDHTAVDDTAGESAPGSPDAELFRTVLDMAQAAKTGNTSGWLAARYRGAALEDLTYLSTAMLGVLIENEAVRRGVHPADAWRELGQRGLDDFG